MIKRCWREDDDEEIEADYLVQCMQKMMLALLFLCCLNSLLDFSYLDMCPWKIETEK